MEGSKGWYGFSIKNGKLKIENGKLNFPSPVEMGIFYINCNAIAGLWFAVLIKVAAACCRICCWIYSAETSAISASLNVERLDTRFSY